MEKLKFWIPFFGGFMIIPDEISYLDASFFKNNLELFLFILWHIGSLLLIIYLFC